MKLGCGPLNVDDMSESRLRETVVGIEAKLYDFVWLGSEAEAIIAGSVAAAVSRDLRILVELDRTLDPLRDAEDLCVLDQLCEGRVGLVLGRAAAADVELVQELRRALDGGRVRGVRVFPRNAQLELPMFVRSDSPGVRARPISREVREGCLLCVSHESDALSLRDQIDERTPLLLSIGDSLETIDALRGAMFIRDELFIDPPIRVTTMPPEGIARRLAPSDLNSPFHRLG